MSAFSDLYQKLENSANANDRIEALVDYFRDAAERDQVWAVHLLMGNKFPGLITKAKLTEWLGKTADFPKWLIDDSSKAVGDVLETYSLLLPSGSRDYSLSEMVNLIDILRNGESFETEVINIWKELSQAERFIFGRLITGTKLLSLPTDIIARAIAEHTGNALADLKTEWDPSTSNFADLSSTSEVSHQHNVVAVVMSIIKSGKGNPEFGLGVWSGDRFVPIGKVEADLEKDELQLVDSWLAQNTVEKYGMAYMVKPELVVEITFAGVVYSKRHKAGLKLTYPKLLMWSKDKTVQEVSSLEKLQQLLDGN